MNEATNVAELPILSVVVPCYNEQDVLPELRQRLIAACESAVGPGFEIILIDDGSRDKTREIMRQYHQEDARFGLVLLSRNFGHQIALTAGLSIARGERVLVIDADLQDPPELLGEMMAKMDEGYDVIYGQRTNREGETRFKKVTAAIFYRLLHRLVDIDIPLDSGDFRLMSRRIVSAINAMPEQHRFIRGMVSWLGYKQISIEYNRNERFAGETKYPLARMIRLALDAITGFSVAPLKLATWLGFLCSLIAALAIVYVFTSWAAGETIQGWTSLTVLVLFIGGIQLMVMGILGEYVGRVYIQTKSRPLFVVDEIVKSEPVSKVMKQ